MLQIPQVARFGAQYTVQPRDGQPFFVTPETEQLMMKLVNTAILSQNGKASSLLGVQTDEQGRLIIHTDSWTRNPKTSHMEVLVNDLRRDIPALYFVLSWVSDRFKQWQDLRQTSDFPVNPGFQKMLPALKSYLVQNALNTAADALVPDTTIRF